MVILDYLILVKQSPCRHHFNCQIFVHHVLMKVALVLVNFRLALTYYQAVV